MNPRHTTALVLALATPLGAQQTPPVAKIPTWKPVIDTVGSAPRIMSPGYTEWRDTTTGWTMSLERTIDLNAEPNSFEKARRPVLLDDGRVLVAQRQPASIALYDADGRFVRSIGREGAGIEEYRGDIGVAAWHDTVVVHDAIQARVLLYSTDGRFIRGFPTDIHTTQLTLDDQGRLRLPITLGLPTGNRAMYVTFTLRGARVDSIMGPIAPRPKAWSVVHGSQNLMYLIPFAPTRSTAFLKDGTMIFGTGDRFEFFATRTGRDTTRIFGRTNVPVVPLDSAFADSLLASLKRVTPDLDTIARRSDLPATMPMWNEMSVDPHGFIWVLSGLRDRRTYVGSIFSPDGRYLGQLSPWFDNFIGFSWNGDRAAWMGFDKDRRPVVRIYKIDRRGM